VLAAAIGGILAVSLLVPSDYAPSLELGSNEAPPRANELPVIVHVILDEQIGIGGIPRDLLGGLELASELRDFYASRDFRVFDHAYSSFFYTRNSLSHLVNLAEDYKPELVRDGSGIFEMEVVRNSYFAAMHGRGYRVRVLQADYIDFCKTDGVDDVIPFQCHTYRAWTIDFLRESGFTARQKLLVLARLYLPLSELYKKIGKLYYHARLSILDRGIALPVALPEWSFDLTRPPMASALAAMDRLAAELATARRGDFFFAHLLLPHSTFAYDAQCALRPPEYWYERRDRTVPSGRSNTPESRARRYDAYFRQSHCVTRRISDVLDALASSGAGEDAIVILHGDHGSRINLFDARDKHREKLTPTDYRDSFSTLLAIRGPGVEAGSDPRIVSIHRLLARYIASGFESLPRAGDAAEPSKVHFTASKKRVASSGAMLGFEPDIARGEQVGKPGKRD
jgi:hypothetical protein